MTKRIKYKRILLKLSGEALMGARDYGIDPERLTAYANDIKDVHDMGIEVAIVIGGGNIYRGLSGAAEGLDRVQGDYMGMLATMINSLALQSTLEKTGLKCTHLSGRAVEAVAEAMNKRKAVDALVNGDVLIISGGTGNPYFTTDTAAALRAVEIGANALLKGTRVDGVYNDDPEKNPQAAKYDMISFEQAYNEKLKIMDLTAFTLCQENKLPVVVFDMNTPGNLKKLIDDDSLGTLVYP